MHPPAPMPPSIRKARRIDGRTLALRDAGESDAAFIHALRTDPVRARFLSAVPPDPSALALWLAERLGASQLDWALPADAPDPAIPADFPVPTRRL